MANKGFIYIDSAGTKKTILGSSGGNQGADNGKIALFGVGGDLTANEFNGDDGFGNTSLFAPTQIVMEAVGLWAQTIRRSTGPGLFYMPLTQGDDLALFGGVMVLFNGAANSNQAATYSRTGTTVTVTLTNHQYITGHVVQADFTSGGALDGTYTITGTPDGDTFTLTTAASGAIAAGSTLNLLRCTIINSRGVHSVTDAGIGTYYVNFKTEFPDTGYFFPGCMTAVPSSTRRYRVAVMENDGTGVTQQACKILGYGAASVTGGADATIQDDARVMALFLR